MGSGASLDQNETLMGRNESSTRTSRYFCHACGRVFAMDNGGIPNSYNCPQCQSSFLEEVERSSSMINTSISNSSTVLSSTILNTNILRARNTVLNNEQSRRLANAAIMLRLLEIQLRDELDSLQNAFNSNLRQLEDKRRPLTVVSNITIVRYVRCINTNQNIYLDCGEKDVLMVALQKLCKRTVCTDMLCSQPSCPVCSEDFQIGGIATFLPCSHFFHDACVMPWLNLKRNCPICRHEITDSVPTIEELEKFSETELLDKLFAMAIPVVPKDTKSLISKNELAHVLYKALSDKKIILDSLDAATVDYSVRQSDRRLNDLTGIDTNANVNTHTHTNVNVNTNTNNNSYEYTNIGEDRGGGGGRYGLVRRSRNIIPIPIPIPIPISTATDTLTQYRRNNDQMTPISFSALVTATASEADHVRLAVIHREVGTERERVDERGIVHNTDVRSDNQIGP